MAASRCKLEIPEINIAGIGTKNSTGQDKSCIPQQALQDRDIEGILCK
jgi:hypothetical protein